MRVIVCGGRNYHDREKVEQVISALPRSTVVVHGGAKGTDRLAAHVAREWGFVVEQHKPDFARWAKGAPFVRNQKMADLGADECIAFPGGSGTQDMIRRARTAGIPVRRVW